MRHCYPRKKDNGKTEVTGRGAQYPSEGQLAERCTRTTDRKPSCRVAGVGVGLNGHEAHGTTKHPGAAVCRGKFSIPLRWLVIEQQPRKVDRAGAVVMGRRSPVSFTRMEEPLEGRVCVGLRGIDFICCETPPAGAR